MNANWLKATGVIGAALVLGGCTVIFPPEKGDSMSSESNPNGRVVVAHYFTWFKTPKVSGGWKNWDWKGRGPQHDPERYISSGRRDIASVYYPLIGPYDSSRPEVIEYHMLSAKAAGIDGFLLDWYGLLSDEEKYMPLLLDIAQKVGFKVGICFEDKAMFGYCYNARTREEAVQNAIANLKHILETHTQHPAYLRVDGQPIVVNFSWTEPTDSVQSQGFSAAEYTRILAEVRRKHALCFIHDFHGHLKESYWDVVDNVYPWLDVNGEHLDRFYATIRQRLAYGKIPYITSLVYPGFDNTGVWGWGDGPFVTPREDGKFYDRSWEKALSNDVRLIQIATWNDFGEGAVIEPTLDFRYQYLQATARHAFRAKGSPPAPDKALLIPLKIYEARVTISRQSEENQGPLAATVDSAVDAFRRGQYEEAEKIIEALKIGP